MWLLTTYFLQLVCMLWNILKFAGLNTFRGEYIAKKKQVTSSQVLRDLQDQVMYQCKKLTVTPSKLRNIYK
jgi:hypothetical protein